MGKNPTLRSNYRQLATKASKTSRTLVDSQELQEITHQFGRGKSMDYTWTWQRETERSQHVTGSVSGKDWWLVSDELVEFKSNQLKFIKTSGILPIILEESIEHTSI